MSLSQVVAPRAAGATPAPPHSWLEDVAAIVTGAFLASLGLFVLASGGVITGGTAGLALLLADTTALPFAAMFLVVSLPFVALAIRGKGVAFTAALGSCPGPGLGVLGPPAARPGGDAHRAALRVPRG